MTDPRYYDSPEHSNLSHNDPHYRQGQDQQGQGPERRDERVRRSSAPFEPARHGWEQQAWQALRQEYEPAQAAFTTFARESGGRLGWAGFVIQLIGPVARC
jgi:hypothetical protein